MTEVQYQHAVSRWDNLDALRREMLSRHNADSDTFLEDEPWYAELQTIELEMEQAVGSIETYEDALMKEARQFVPSIIDGKIREPGDFAWDHWEQWAKEDGISENLASLGRAVIREAYQHNWPEPLKEECGWSDDGVAMIQLAIGQPDRARIRWQYLLDSDGDFHWAD